MLNSWFFRRTRPALLVLMATVLVAVSGCGTTDIPSPVHSSFEAELTGDLNMHASGEAYFADSYQQFEDGSAQRAFMIELQDFAPPTYDLFRFMRLEWGNPPVGTHSIAVGATSTTFQVTFVRHHEDTEHTEIELSSTTGTLTLTEVGTARIRGSFQFQAVGTRTPEPGLPPVDLVVEVAGHFTAARGS